MEGSPRGAAPPGERVLKALSVLIDIDISYHLSSNLNRRRRRIGGAGARAGVEGPPPRGRAGRARAPAEYTTPEAECPLLGVYVLFSKVVATVDGGITPFLASI